MRRISNLMGNGCVAEWGELLLLKCEGLGGEL